MVQRPQRRGAEIFAYELSEQLRRFGVTVKIVYLYDAVDDMRLPLRTEDMCLNGQEEHPLERFPGFHFGLLRDLTEEITSFAPDIVQVNGARTVKYGAATKHLVSGEWKLIYRNIGLPSHWHRSWRTVMAYRLLIVPRIDGVVGVSEHSLTDAVDLYGLNVPRVVICNGVDPEKLQLDRDRETVRRSLGVDDHRVLLFVGTLTPEKRPDRFVRVASALMGEDDRVRAWVVGTVRCGAGWRRRRRGSVCRIGCGCSAM